MTKDNTIEIALASDKRFYPGLLVTAYSIAENAGRDYVVVFHILDGGIGDELRTDLECRLNAVNPRSSVDWLSIDHDTFKDLPEWRGCGKMTWARIFLPHLLPATDWIIYYDVDYLCLANVAELWLFRDKNVSYMSTLDNWPLTIGSELEWSRKYHLEFDATRYVCAGFGLFNLARIRQMGFTEKLANVMTNCQDYPANDQSVLNAVFNSTPELKLLPRKWQAFTRDMTEDDITNHHNLHYAGEAPWVCLPKNWILNDASIFWFRYYSRIKGISTWKAMREFYSAFDLLKYRALYLLFSRISLMRKLLHLYFCAIRHDGSIVIYDALLHRFNMPRI